MMKTIELMARIYEDEQEIKKLQDKIARNRSNLSAQQLMNKFRMFGGRNGN